MRLRSLAGLIEGLLGYSLKSFEECGRCEVIEKSEHFCIGDCF
jgi:hypothetical protein